MQFNFQFLYFLQLRVNLIAEANEDLKNKVITPMAFLNRVIFQRMKKQDDFLLSFEHLAELEDDLEDDLFSLTNSNGDAAEASDQPEAKSSDDNLCGVCVLNERDCVLIPCGHLFFCMVCWDKYKTTDTSNFNFIDEDGNIIDAPEIDEPLQTVICPYCKKTVNNAIKLRPT